MGGTGATTGWDATTGPDPAPGPGAPSEAGATTEPDAATEPGGTTEPGGATQPGGTTEPDATTEPGGATQPGATAGPDRPDATGAPSAARRGRVGRAVALTVTVVALVLVLAGAWVAFRVWRAVSALQDARVVLERVDLEVSSVDAAWEDLTGLRDATSRAAAAASDPVWRASEAVPWVGDQLTAVRVVAVSLDAVAGDVLPAAQDLRALVGGGVRGTDGHVDLVALGDLAGQVESAAATAADARAAVAAIDVDRLAGPLVGPVRQVQDALVRVDDVLGPAGRTAGVLPAMLGADGPRTYLVLALNTAELRAAGGIVGTVVAVRVEGGAMSIVDRRTTQDLPTLAEPVTPLTAEELDVWGERLGRWVQNAVLTPDFPRTAELVAARWAQAVGGTVDGVVGTDPVAVSGLVGATGPLADPDGGQLDAAGLAGVLLRDAYVRHPDPAASDAYFGAVAETIVGAVVGSGDTAGLLTAARGAVDERRLRVWSAHPQEQERLAATVAGAAFTSDLFADQPGLFLDDATQGKLGAYLATGVTFRDATCTGPDPAVTVVLRLAYEPPAGIEGWPAYVTGQPGPDVPLGTLLTAVSVWSARGDGPPAVTRDGAPAAGRTAALGGRSVLQLTSRLAPGQTQEVAARLALRHGRVTVWTTPTLTSPGSATYRCDSPG